MKTQQTEDFVRVLKRYWVASNLNVTQCANVMVDFQLVDHIEEYVDGELNVRPGTPLTMISNQSGSFVVELEFKNAVALYRAGKRSAQNHFFINQTN